MGEGYAYCCEVCDEPEPRWRVTRRGDVAVSWACVDHLDAVCDRLQRDYEVTELVVVLAQKAKEWAEIGATFAALPDNTEGR